MTNVDRDIKNALKVIKQIDYKPFVKFSNVSSVFRGTNENINGYFNCYIGTKNVLTVILPSLNNLIALPKGEKSKYDGLIGCSFSFLSLL